ncbi:hypothetical protein SYNTR_0385 [Candidatus Syntrophocurvum alkaliphilum]|uniref:Copper transporter n=1 Tax=Candidatus Syntrophocurvum alkaliphilum TaxID=2293317 RepID=A0A6I6DEL5_9FIRM|nr:copper transporter [Candidatus Syntrophocurvum alkaliphilum]QGT98978.1 hypothetical protein SYNTR_0385 [Candidatus Syntrophocurvum alkaliphilum]
MIDLRYHIASLIGIFLALGLGILIGSTIVSDDLMVDQQSKIIDRLEEQFYLLREREKELIAENEINNNMINHYEGFSKTILPAIVKERLSGKEVAIVVTGGKEIPADMLNTLNTAGVEIVSETIILPNINMNDTNIRKNITEYYELSGIKTADELQTIIADNIARIIASDESCTKVMQTNKLAKFTETNNRPINNVIVLGGADENSNFFPQSIDQTIINILISKGVNVYGVESSCAEYSYINEYQKLNISTIDNIDLSIGQISLILAMEGKPGHYGIKSTADKFMPTLPIDNIGGQ